MNKSQFIHTVPAPFLNGSNVSGTLLDRAACLGINAANSILCCSSWATHKRCGALRCGASVEGEFV